MHNTKPTDMLAIEVGPGDPPGTKPEDKIRRCAGDDLTGFWEERAPDLSNGLASREAYSWGNINASPTKQKLQAVTRAAWLILLPYALVNVGYWTRSGLRDTKDKAGRWAGATAFRVAGLLLTAVFVTTATQIGTDLIAWQCYLGDVARCGSLPSWVDFMKGLDRPTQRLAVGCAVPLVVLLALWLLSRQSLQRYEEVPGPETPGDPGHVLETEGFWNGRGRVLRLQRLHLAAGLACVVAVTGWPVQLLAKSGPRLWLYFDLVFAVAVLLGCLVVAAAQVTDGPDYADQSPPLVGVPGVLLKLAALTTVSHLAAFWFADFGVKAEGPLPGSGAFPLVLTLVLVSLVLGVFVRHLLLACTVVAGFFVAGVGLYHGLDRLDLDNPASRLEWRDAGLRLGAAAVALCLAGWLLHRVRRKQHRFDGWGGAGPAVLLGAAVFFSLLYSTSAMLLAADRLNGGDSVTQLVASPVGDAGDGAGAGAEPAKCTVETFTDDRIDLACTRGHQSQRRLSVPIVNFWLAPGLSAALVSWLLVAAAAYGAFSFSSFSRRQIPRQAEKDYDEAEASLRAGYDPDDPDFRKSRREFQLRQMVTSRRHAEFAHRAERLVGLLCPTTALAILLAMAGATSRLLPWQYTAEDTKPTTGIMWAGRTSLVVIAAVAAGLIALGTAAYKTAPLRGSLGIIWDLASFWPRAAHPFSPPCYAERVVPDLCVRVGYRLHRDGRVILSGHSLGSTLAVATYFRFSVEDRKRLALLSYGSQLRAYFGRVFPAVYGADVLGNAPAVQPRMSRNAISEVRASPKPGTLAEQLAAGTPERRWLSLFRRTDYLGFRVYDDVDNDVDRSTLETTIPWPPGDPKPPEIETHGDYPRTKKYDDTLAELLPAPPPDHPRRSWPWRFRG